MIHMPPRGATLPHWSHNLTILCEHSQKGGDMLVFFLISQAAIADKTLADVRFDLRNVAPAPPKDEIIVTARRRDERAAFRTAQDLQPELLFPQAETDFIGGTRIGASAQNQGLSSGVVSNRAMITLKKKF